MTLAQSVRSPWDIAMHCARLLASALAKELLPKPVVRRSQPRTKMPYVAKEDVVLVAQEVLERVGYHLPGDLVVSSPLL